MQNYYANKTQNYYSEDLLACDQDHVEEIQRKEGVLVTRDDLILI